MLQRKKQSKGQYKFIRIMILNHQKRQPIMFIIEGHHHLKHMPNEKWRLIRSLWPDINKYPQGNINTSWMKKGAGKLTELIDSSDKPKTSKTPDVLVITWSQNYVMTQVLKMKSCNVLQWFTRFIWILYHFFVNPVSDGQLNEREISCPPLLNGRPFRELVGPN